MKPSQLPAADSQLEAVARLITQYKTLYVQEKYNGVGFRARPNRVIITEPQFVTTRDKVWPTYFFPAYTASGIKCVLDRLPQDTTLYGEILARDDRTPLATLAGAINVNSKTANPAVELRFMVYDYHSPSNPMSFSGRLRTLGGIFSRFCWSSAVGLAPTHTYDNATEIMDLYHDLTNDSREGLILRADPCFFCDGRSPLMWKLKRKHEAEGVCVAVEEGEGKRKGLLGALYVQTPNGVLKLGGGPGMTDDVLRTLLAKPPIGKDVTYSYEELSSTGLPLRPQLIALRDYES